MLYERRNEIINKIRQFRILKVADLIEEYKVSIETIRRDLEYLEQQGYLTRVYGGAVLREFNEQKADHRYHEIVNYPHKRAIGKKAAEYVHDWTTVFIDLGTTTMEVVKQLRLKKNLTIITNSILIAGELANSSESCRVILLGGELRREELSLWGTVTDEILGRFYASTAIIGLGGISPYSGITDYHFSEASTRRIMIERADEVIAVADHSKFEVTAPNFICPVEKLDTLITDWMTPDSILDEYRSRGVNIIVAKEEG